MPLVKRSTTRPCVQRSTPSGASCARIPRWRGVVGRIVGRLAEALARDGRFARAFGKGFGIARRTLFKLLHEGPPDN